jgi:hypothetical protein
VESKIVNQTGITTNLENKFKKDECLKSPNSPHTSQIEVDQDSSLPEMSDFSSSKDKTQVNNLEHQLSDFLEIE